MGVHDVGRSLLVRCLLRRGLGAFALLAALCTLVSAQETWPNRPIKLVVPLTAGGGVDMMARITAQHLSDQLGQRVLVENQGGAGGTIAANMVAHSRPDGYTLIFQSVSSAVVNAYVYKNLQYDPIKDLIPVTLAGRFPLVLVANPDLPAKDMGELIRLLKANPGKYKCSVARSGNHNAGDRRIVAGRTNGVRNLVESEFPARIEGVRPVDRNPGNLIDDFKQDVLVFRVFFCFGHLSIFRSMRKLKGQVRI